MTPVPRPPRITKAAVVLAIGSGLAVAMGLFALTGAVFYPLGSAGGPSRALIVASPILLLAFGAWGLATSRGLLRLQPWARISMVVLSALLGFFGAMGTFFLLTTNIPAPPGITPDEFRTIRGIVVVVYFLFLVIGVWWQVQFSSPRIRAVFRGEGEREAPPASAEPVPPPAPAASGWQRAPAPTKSARPLSITIIGWYLLAGTLSSAVQVLMGVPATFAGRTFTGPPGSLIYLAMFAAQAYLGIGLLQLQPLSRILAVCFFLVGFANTALFVALPGREERLAAMVRALPDSMQPPPGAPPELAWWLPLISAAVVTILPVWFLVTRKNAFTPGQQP